MTGEKSGRLLLVPTLGTVTAVTTRRVLTTPVERSRPSVVVVIVGDTTRGQGVPL